MALMVSGSSCPGGVSKRRKRAPVHANYLAPVVKQRNRARAEERYRSCLISCHYGIVEGRAPEHGFLICRGTTRRNERIKTLATMSRLKAYKLYSTASYLTPDLKIVKTQFQIEETRFTQWGIHCGYGGSTGCTLDETVESAGRNVVSTVRLTLAQISTLLKEYETVSARYNDPGRGQAYRGMAWALKDKARLESIVSNLNDFNNALHQLLPRQNEQSLSQAVACALTGSNEGRKLDDLIAAMGSLQFNDAAKLARFKRAYQMLAMEDEQEVAQLPASPSTLQVDVGRFQFSSRYSSEDRTFGSLDNSFRVIVEWKAYHPSMTSGSATSRMILRHRASHLAELMSGRSQRPEGFNALSCADTLTRWTASDLDSRTNSLCMWCGICHLLSTRCSRQPRLPTWAHASRWLNPFPGR